MNNKKIAWITDSSSSLSKEFLAEHDNVYVVPLNIVINGVSYKENIDLTEKELYERMQEEEGDYQTSLPAIGEFVDLYNQLKEEYDFGIAVHVSSKLSGTYQTSIMAAEIAGFPLYPIDSLTGSFPLTSLIHKGISLAKEGLAVEDLVAKLQAYKENNKMYIIPSNLQQLHKSGRISGSQKLIASLFNIKPIITFNGGEAILKEKVRSEKKAFASVIQKLKEDYNTYKITKVAVLHANHLEKAHQLKQIIQEELPDITIEIMMLISAAGIHTGAKTMGLAWVYEK